MATRLAALLAAGAFFVSACAADAPAPEGGAPGALYGAMTFDGPQHDVAYMAYRVVPLGGTCDDPAVAETTSPMEEEFLPLWLAPNEATGAMHPFADALFVLPPGDYLVCATPLDASMAPSVDCAPTQGTGTVVASETTEIVLLSQCEGDPTGGLDVVVALNDPPRIDHLELLPSKFIVLCQDLTLTVTASDPNGDALTYAWEVLQSPAGSSPAIDGAGPSVTFSTDQPGAYLVQVTVEDGHGGTARLSFPVHVSGAQAVDICGNGVDDDCDGEVDDPGVCSPCPGPLVFKAFEVTSAASDACHGGNDYHSLWLPGFFDGDASHLVRMHFLPGARFDWYVDDTATITGLLEVGSLGGGPGVVGAQYAVQLALVWRGQGAAGVGSGGPKKELKPECQSSLETDTWNYFDIQTEGSFLVPVGGPADDVTTFVQAPPDSVHPMQVGLTANGKNYTVGASAWFFYTHTSAAGTWERKGDINVDLTEIEVPACPQ